MRSDAASPDVSSAYQETHTFWQHPVAFTEGVAYQPASTSINDTGHVGMSADRTRNDHNGTYASAVGWSQQGQAALVHGNGRPAAAPGH